jgi:hypothetical protein
MKEKKKKKTHLCTDSLNFSSSRNWSMRNTNSLLKEVISATQIWNSTTNFDLSTPIFNYHHHTIIVMYKTAQNSNSTNHRQIGVENHTTNSLLQSELTRTRKLRASRRLHYKIKFEIEEYYHEFRVFRVWSFEDKKRGKRKNGWTRFPRCVVQHESLSFLLKPSDICTFTYHISGIDYHFVLSFREWYVDTRGINLLCCGFETEIQI